MKSLKAAAVVAGSVLAAGAAAPAFAHDTTDLRPTSVNGAVKTLAGSHLTPADAMPLQHRSNVLDTEHKGSPLYTVSGATDTLNAKGSGLLGGLPPRG
jgi:hypothetical protein